MVATIDHSALVRRPIRRFREFATTEDRTDYDDLCQRFRVVAVDLRGHGGSSWSTDYSFETMRNDIIRLLDALGFLAVIPIGHSTGALVA
jgi:pimeloyl-ACP methyl ester carboxylesterase